MKSAVPLVSGAVAMTAPARMSSTDPPGTPPPGETGLTAAVKTMASLVREGFTDDVSWVVVLAVRTDWVTAEDVLGAKPLSPRYEPKGCGFRCSATLG